MSAPSGSAAGLLLVVLGVWVLLLVLVGGLVDIVLGTTGPTTSQAVTPTTPTTPATTPTTTPTTSPTTAGGK